MNACIVNECTQIFLREGYFTITVNTVYTIQL